MEVLRLTRQMPFRFLKGFLVALVGVIVLTIFLTTLMMQELFAQGSPRIDIRAAINSGMIIVRLKPLFDIGGLGAIFDGDPSTLARTASINPARIILEFQTRFTIDRSRLLMSSGDGQWTLEVADSLPDLEYKKGSYQLLFHDRPTQMDVWDDAQFTAMGRVIRLTALRTTGDNYVHLNEWELYGSYEPLPILGLRAERDSLQLYEGWRWKHTRLFAMVEDSSEIEVLTSEAVWTSSDPTVASVDESGIIFTHNAGTATVTATYQEQQADIHVTVLAAAHPPVFEQIDPFLATPTPNHIYEIPVVIFRFLPTRNGIDLDVSYAPDFWWLHEITLEKMIQEIDANDRMVKFMLEERSRFRGYKDSTAIASLGYKVVAYITVYEQTPPGDVFRYEDGYPIFGPDYKLIFEKFNIEHYVNDLGVKEIWVWMNQLSPGIPCYDPAIHRPENFRTIWESNMASPTTGDISNSNRNNDDLPIYNSTYVVFDRNLRRFPLTLHVHGHQQEVMLSYINYRQDRNTDLFWKKFVGEDDYGNFITGRCGWTHMPPNTTENYDYFNSTLVESDIEDWTPDRVGETKLVNADTWGSLDYAYPEDILDDRSKTEANWYVYWMQNMPGFGNTIQYNGNYMTNWWLFTADWDRAIASNIGLYSPEPTDVFKLEIDTEELTTGTYQHAYCDFVTAQGGLSPYSWSIHSGNLPTGLSLNQSTGEISGTPSASGTFDFSLIVTDAQATAQSDTAAFTITILNHAPYFVSSDSLSVVEKSELSYTARAIDPDSNRISYTFADYPGWLVPADSTISGTPSEGAKDTSFIAIASDGEMTDSLRVNVEVIAANKPPQIINLADFAFFNDQAYTIVLDTCVIDPDDSVDSMSWQITPADTNLRVAIVQRVASFTAPDWVGTTDVLLKVTDPQGASDSVSVKATVNFPSLVDRANTHIPDSFFLAQNYPNPFHLSTTVHFGLPKSTNVTISVFNLLGEKVAEIFKGKKQAGFHSVSWKARHQPAGLYLIKMQGNNFVLVRKCVLLK